MPRDTREPQEILEHVISSRVELTSAIYGLSEAELTREGATGEWSVKDVMAHLGRWEEICFDELHKHLRGERSTETIEMRSLTTTGGRLNCKRFHCRRQLNSSRRPTIVFSVFCRP